MNSVFVRMKVTPSNDSDNKEPPPAVEKFITNSSWHKPAWGQVDSIKMTCMETGVTSQGLKPLQQFIFDTMHHTTELRS